MQDYINAFNAALETLAQTPAADTLHLHDETPQPTQRGPYQTAIEYSRGTHDYAMYINGELAGFERTYHAADVVLAQLVHELQCAMYFREAA